MQADERGQPSWLAVPLPEESAAQMAQAEESLGPSRLVSLLTTLACLGLYFGVMGLAVWVLLVVVSP